VRWVGAHDIPPMIGNGLSWHTFVVLYLIYHCASLPLAARARRSRIYHDIDRRTGPGDATT
jgi:hypothetical protein